MAIEAGRLAATKHSIYYLCPLALTFGILQLSWRGVYWQDLDDSSPVQNSVMVTIQFIAKLHEIFIVASLSTILLIQIQSELTQDDGVPFGLLTSAYRVSSITYLCSWEFWSALVEQRLFHTYFKRLCLFGLVILASLLAAVAGPSSAIILLPRLYWWPVSSPAVDSTLNYIGNETFDLWPRTLTAKNLPGTNCLDGGGFGQRYCPSAGRSAFESWFNGRFIPEPNLTISISDSSMVRYLASSAYTTETTQTGLTLSSTLHDIVAKTLSCTYDLLYSGWRVYSHGFDTHMGRPIIHEALFKPGSLYKPLISTHCRSYKVSDQNKSFPHELLYSSGVENRAGALWHVPDMMWNTSTDVLRPTKFSWMNSPADTNSPSIAAVSVVTLPSAKGRPHPPDVSDEPLRRVVPCTVEAWWIPTDIWIDPKTDSSIHDNMADIVYKGLGPKSSGPEGGLKIKIDQSWAEALNVKPKGVNATVFEDLITPRLTPFGAIPYVEDTISYLLGLHVAEGIARVHSDATPWHLPGPILRAPANVGGKNATCAVRACQRNRMQCGTDIEGKPAALNYTRVTFNVVRYGYGWGLQGPGIKLATAALLLHAVLCVAFAVKTVYSGRSFSFARTVGEMVALAMNSAPTDKLRGTCAGIQSLGVWEKTVNLLETDEDHLELVFDNDGDGGDGGGGGDDDDGNHSTRTTRRRRRTGNRPPQAGNKYGTLTTTATTTTTPVE